MKKYLIGFIAGILAVRATQTAVRKEAKIHQALKLVDTGFNVFNEGFVEGKKFNKTYHEVHHPDCDRCPH